VCSCGVVPPAEADLGDKAADTATCSGDDEVEVSPYCWNCLPTNELLGESKWLLAVLLVLLLKLAAAATSCALVPAAALPSTPASAFAVGDVDGEEYAEDATLAVEGDTDRDGDRGHSMPGPGGVVGV
jgi:hypothetical protein